ncbi:MAG: transposase [Pseudanabaenaceae cyanobacterium]
MDSTVILLASKLFWRQGYHPGKILNTFDFSRGIIADFCVSFGQNHDMSFKDKIINMIPKDSMAVMDIGFCSYQFVHQLCQIGRWFIVRIKRNMKELQNNHQYRVVSFCDLETKTEYYLASIYGNDDKIAEMYRQRQQIEILYKFLRKSFAVRQINQ